MSENCTHNCDTCTANCSSKGNQQENSFAAPANAMSDVKKVIAVISGKGGVGKSLVTGLLAVNARRNDLETAVLDADITGPSVPRMFGYTEKAMGNDLGIFPGESKTGIRLMSVNMLLENETDPVVWRGPVIAGTVKQFWSDVQWGRNDVMFIDMPPGTGDVPLTVFQSLPINGVVVVGTPQELVSMIVEKAVNMAGMMNIPVLAIVENMSYIECPDCGKKIPVFGESRVEELAERLGVKRVAKIPISSKLAGACDKGLIELFEGDWLDGVIEDIINL